MGTKHRCSQCSNLWWLDAEMLSVVPREGACGGGGGTLAAWVFSASITAAAKQMLNAISTFCLLS